MREDDGVRPRPMPLVLSDPSDAWNPDELTLTMQADSSDPRSLQAKRALAAFLVAVLALLLFVGSEAFVRITRPHDDLWALTGRSVASHPIGDWYFLDAFSAYRARPGMRSDGSVVKTVDSAGFISTPEIAAAKPPNTIRIAFVGESSTAGTGILLPDTLTWPWQVVELLRQRPGRRSRIEFINAAIGGFTTFESYGRLWSRLLRFYSPDIVVIYHGWNEMYYFNSVDKLAAWRTLPDGSWGFESVVPVTVYEPRWYDWLLRPSQILTKVRLRMAKPLGGELSRGALQQQLIDSFDHRAPEVFRTNLRLIKDAARLLGMRLYVGKQATLIVRDLAESEQGRCRYDLHGFDHAAHVEAFRAIYRVIDEEIPPDYIIDVTSLSGVPENFYDHIHPTPLGAERTAVIMANALAPAVDSIEAGLARVPEAN
jgi:hypothetical protein